MEKSQYRVNYATEEYINILKPPVGMKSEKKASCPHIFTTIHQAAKNRRMRAVEIPLDVIDMLAVTVQLGMPARAFGVL